MALCGGWARSVVARLANAWPHAFPSLPKTVNFHKELIAGEAWMTAQLQFTDSITTPCFLTPGQHAGLQRFINEAPTSCPRLLMAVGSRKSGKSLLAKTVLPGMIAAAHADQWPASRRFPVLVIHDVCPATSAEQAASSLCSALSHAGRKASVPLEQHQSKRETLAQLPQLVEAFSKRLHEAGGELWMIVDGIHGVGTASPPDQLAAFTHRFREVVERCSPYSRAVVTSGGLDTFLNAFRVPAASDLALWDATTILSLDAEPSLEAARCMAASILRRQAGARNWPSDARAAITADAVVGQLAAEAGSLHPALLDYAICQTRDLWTNGPTFGMEQGVGNAATAMLRSPMRDTLRSMTVLQPAERRLLRALAGGECTRSGIEEVAAGRSSFREAPLRVDASRLATFIGSVSLAREHASDRLQLPPQYTLLLREWLSASGDIVVKAGCFASGSLVDALAHGGRLVDV